MLTTRARRIGIRVTYLSDERLEALIVPIMLITRTLITFIRITLKVVMRKFCLYAITNFDNGKVRCSLKNCTGNKITHTIGEFLINRLTTCFTDNGSNNVFSVLSRDTANVIGRNIALFKFGVFSRFFIRLANRNELKFLYMTSISINNDSRVIL